MEKAPPIEPEGLISVSLQSLTRACQEFSVSVVAFITSVPVTIILGA